MKNLFFLLLIVACTSLHAQTKTKPAPGKKPKAAAASPFKDTDLAGKEWKLKSWEQFGIVKAPDDSTKNDMLLLNADNTFKLVLNNKSKTGTWKKSGAFIFFTQPDNAAEKLVYKILSLEKNNLKVDWREAESLHNTLEFESN